MGTGQQKNEQIVSAQADSGSMQSSQDIKLSWREKICYGFGDLGNGFMFDLGQAYLTKFYTDICLISPGVVSLIFAATKISMRSWTRLPVHSSTVERRLASTVGFVRL